MCTRRVIKSQREKKNHNHIPSITFIFGFFLFSTSTSSSSISLPHSSDIRKKLSMFIQHAESSFCYCAQLNKTDFEKFLEFHLRVVDICNVLHINEQITNEKIYKKNNTHQMICVCVYETHISISTALRCLLAILYSPKDKNLNEQKRRKKKTHKFITR